MQIPRVPAIKMKSPAPIIIFIDVFISLEIKFIILHFGSEYKPDFAAQILYLFIDN
jgi:hypothetical protein